jgi:hypothetical protein
MKSLSFRLTLLAALVFALVSLPAQAQLGSTVANWRVPSAGATSTPGVRTTMTDVTQALPFIGVTPCRIVDTRNATGTFGGPALVAGVPRNFPLPTGPCPGLPALPRAYSLNITVTNTQGSGFILIYPQGGAQPVVSTLNYNAGDTVANAAIVPAGTGGGVTVVAGVSGTNLIIDINGYFTDVPGGGTAQFNYTNNTALETMVLQNLSTTCGGICGLFQGVASGLAIQGVGVSGGVLGTASSSSTGVFGVEGSASATTGKVSGVRGFNATAANDTAGVFGTDNTTFTPNANLIGGAGVRGEGKNGVVGVTSASVKDIGGVVGLFLDAGGGLGAFGVLGSSFTVAGQFFGNTAATGTKSFVEPYPSDPEKVIKYVSLEGPEAGTYFRGTARTVNHRAVIDVPEHFRIVTDTDGMTVQVTPVGAMANMFVESEDLNQIVVQSSKEVTFHYLVQGVRKAFKDFQVIENGTDFIPSSANATMPGYLSAEARKRLIANGTYNEDGTVNMTTAGRVGWTQMWAEKEAANKAAAEKASAEMKAAAAAGRHSQ